MTGEPAGGQAELGGQPASGGEAAPGEARPVPGGEARPVIELGNEFARVVVERVTTRNGARLRISVPASGREILLCPLELEALTWQDHELFAGLLRTPHGPES